MAQLLTVEELAEQLQISVKSIYNLRSAGAVTALPAAIKVGKYLRWRQADVDAWIESLVPQSNVTPIAGRTSA
jgi:excisionase family DNA binding protein